MRNSLLLTCFVCLVYISGHAQWSTDPSVNTFIAGSDQDHTFPKIVATPEGNFYISSWKDVGPPDYYQLWLQYVDYNGNLLWGTDGIQISNQKCRSWLTDYSLAVDPDGNALLAIEDLRGFGGYSHAAVYAVAPDRHAVWDTNGILLSVGLADAFSPTICLTGLNNVLVAWNAEMPSKDTNTHTFIRIQKLSPAGEILWPQPLTIAGQDSNYMFPTLVPVGPDDFILVWQKKFELGSGYGSEWYTYFYAMRYGPDGQSKWAQPAKLCDHGDSAFVMPQFQLLRPFQDERQGVFVTWFDDRYETGFSNIYLQHVDTTGKLRWVVNGIPVTLEDAGYDRVEPWGIYDQTGESTVIFWEEMRPAGAFESFGIVGQRTDYAGGWQWGDQGKTIAGFSQDTSWNIFGMKPTLNQEAVLLIDWESDSIVGSDTLLYNELYATRVDTAGLQTWATPLVLMAATEGTKYYPEISDLTVDIFVVSWCENRSSPFDPDGSVYAQAISQKGNLGPSGIPDIQGSGTPVFIYPNPTNDLSRLRFLTPVSGTVELDILTPYGQYIGSKHVMMGHGLQEILLSSQELPSGLYILRIRYDGQETAVKWMVMR